MSVAAQPMTAPALRDATPLPLAIGTGLMLIVSLYLIFIWAPNESTMGVVQRIFYFHMPSAIVSWVAFIIGGVAAIRYLSNRDPRFDDLSVACNETGLVFCVVNLVTGMLWARPVWGIWWANDPRGNSALMLAVIYAGYLILRQSTTEPSQRAVVCAVVSILGMVDIPIIYMANRWWRTQHPGPVVFGGGLDERMWLILTATFFSLLVLLWMVVRARRRLAILQRETEGLRRMVHAL